jgi:DNA-binding phage protein
MSKQRIIDSNLLSFDLAKYLVNVEAATEYLAAIIYENDPDLLRAAQIDVARAGISVDCLKFKLGKTD